jgi:phosphatidylcholine synthase
MRWSRGVELTENNTIVVGWQRRCLGWLIHAFTASGAFVGLLALVAIHEGRFLSALWLMGVAILIDAVDGMFARVVKIKLAVPQIDGALLDNIVDFFTYTIVPCFFLLVSPLLPDEWRIACVVAITFSSAYQFTQLDAKTSDHFFKGFPSYWNIVVFYLYLWQTSMTTNVWVLLVLAILSFVPIKYVYPSRLDYLTHNAFLRTGMLVATILWGIATAYLLWAYPEANPVMSVISMSYLILYVCISLYRTWVPLLPLIKPANLRQMKAKRATRRSQQ